MNVQAPVPQPSESILVEPRKMSTILLWSVVGFFLLLFLWAAFTKIDRTVHAIGRIVPTAQLQVVSNLEGGVIREIMVRAGSPVVRGTPLIRLDPTSTTSEFSASSSTLASLNAKIARLEAEVTGKTPSFPVSPDPTIQEQVDIERSLYLSRQAAQASTTAAARANLIQAQRAVTEAQANRDAAVANRNGLRQQVAVTQPLVESGVEPRLSLIQSQRQLSAQEGAVAAAQAAIARAAAAVAQARAALAEADEDWRSRAATDLAAAQAEAIGRKRALPALEDRLDRTTVRSPLVGHVNRVLVNTVGGTARPAEPLVEIVPSRSGLTIEAAVKPVDIAFVRAGQRSLVKITAYDYSVYGGLEGRVVGISPDATVDERTGESHYTVRIRTAQSRLRSPTGQVLPITAGMIADVNLIGDKRSVLGYLLTPFTRLSESAFSER